MNTSIRLFYLDQWRRLLLLVSILSLESLSSLTFIERHVFGSTGKTHEVSLLERNVVTHLSPFFSSHVFCR